MVSLDDLAEAARQRDAMKLRSLVQDLLSSEPRLIATPRPTSRDPQLLAIAAGLIELLAERTHQPAPQWTAQVGPAPHPFHLLRAAETMPRLREICEREAPLPLRRRGLFAPANFLEHV